VNIISPEEQVQKMMAIIYQIPMGLIETDLQGNIKQMNAKSVQLLMPYFYKNRLNGTNLHELLEKIAAELLIKVNKFQEPNGTIINQKRQEISFGNDLNKGIKQQFIFTVNKLDEKSLMYIFDDISELYKKERELSLSIQDKAIEQSKFEMASGVLHDIGNAVVGFGSYITRIKRSFEQNDITTLENLKGFIEKNQITISETLGEKKANAIVELLDGILTNQRTNLSEIKQTIHEQMKIIGHVQEILNIQRQYVVGQSTERTLVNIRSICNDSISMITGSFEKKGIQFNFEAPVLIPKIKGDRTRLMQVVLNLLKNAIESFNDSEKKDKLIDVKVFTDQQKITIQIKDNGKGFDSLTAEKIFQRGFTTKSEGSGLGLANCRNIIQGHNGDITLTSEGIDKGATSTIVFNLIPDLKTHE
jgi:signal transduction histidine kinase